MPVLYQHTINNEAKLAVWQIEEPASFFLNQLPPFLSPPPSHPEKQLQFLASRHLLNTLSPSFPFEEVHLSPAGKPILSDRRLYFSISHCRHFAAVAINTAQPCGIDVEIITRKATKLIPKFLSEEEQRLMKPFSDHPLCDQMATLCWSIKETMYKWHGDGGIDFRKHLHIQELSTQHNGIVRTLFHKNNPVELHIEYRIINSCILTWTSADK